MKVWAWLQRITKCMNRRKIESMQNDIKLQLLDAYQKPTQKFAFFSGKNDPDFAKVVGKPHWDWTPQETVNFDPWFWNTHTIALAMGCKPRITSEGKEWAAPLIRSPEQVDKISVPDPLDGRTGEIIEDIEDVLLDLPEDALIRMPDIQSPLGVAELMWRPDSFYMALLTSPNEMHQLLQKITEFIIAYVGEIQAILGDRLNPACFPEIWSDPTGYYIADDSNSLVSPEMHLEYSVRYINRITESCGPLHYHSCTWKRAYFDNIRRIKNIKAVNWAVSSSDDPADIINEFSGDYLLCPHIGVDSHSSEALSGNHFQDQAELVAYMLDHMVENTTFYFWLQPELVQNTKVMKKIYALFESRGYTPR